MQWVSRTRADRYCMLLHDSAVWPDCRTADCCKWSIINHQEWCKTSCSNHLVCNVKLVRTKSGWVSRLCKRNLGSASDIVGSWIISCVEGKQSRVFGWVTRDPGAGTNHVEETLSDCGEQCGWQCWNQCLMSGQGSDVQVGRGTDRDREIFVEWRYWVVPMPAVPPPTTHISHTTFQLASVLSSVMSWQHNTVQSYPGHVWVKYQTRVNVKQVNASLECSLKDLNCNCVEILGVKVRHWPLGAH